MIEEVYTAWRAHAQRVEREMLFMMLHGYIKVRSRWNLRGRVKWGDHSNSDHILIVRIVTENDLRTIVGSELRSDVELVGIDKSDSWVVFHIQRRDVDYALLVSIEVDSLLGVRSIHVDSKDVEVSAVDGPWGAIFAGWSKLNINWSVIVERETWVGEDVFGCQNDVFKNDHTSSTTHTASDAIASICSD